MIALTITHEYNGTALVVVAIAMLILLACEAKRYLDK
jgi:hypothetical protein